MVVRVLFLFVVLCWCVCLVSCVCFVVLCVGFAIWLFVSYDGVGYFWLVLVVVFCLVLCMMHVERGTSSKRVTSK